MWIVSLAIIKLCLIASLGFFLYKRGFIDNKVTDFLTFFVSGITIPFLIFSHLIKNVLLVSNYPVFLFIILSIIIFLAGYIIGYFFRSKGKSENEFISLISFQNCAYLPMSISFFLFPEGVKDTFITYIILYMLGFNVLIWSVGSFFIFRNKEEQFQPNSIFTPSLYATLIALFLIYTKIYPFVPRVLVESMEMAGNTSFVLSMILLGSGLAGISLDGFYKKLWLIGKLVLLKLFLIPLIFLFAVLSLRVFSLLGLFIVMEASMPSAASLPIVAEIRRADREFISQGVFLTHLVSIFSVPFWLGLFLKLSHFSF